MFIQQQHKKSTMKNSIIITCLLVLGLSSCNDFLELPSRTNLTSATFFKTQADFEKAVTGAYAPLRDLFNSGANGATGSWLMGEMHSDNSRYIYNPNFRATIDQEQVADFIYNPTNTAATNKYQGYYLVIARANEVLARIDGVEFDATIKANLKGQALFLRALAYFDLVQYFGDIPLHLTPATSLSNVALPLTPEKDIYTQIIADATLAASSLLPKSTQEPGRATSGAAKTLLGNVYVVLKQYAAAETVLKEVVTSTQYQLLPNYGSVFALANKNSKESVFEVQYLEGTGGFASNFMYSFFPSPISAPELTTLMATYSVAPANLQALTGEAFNIPSPELIAAYETGDLRKAATIGSGVTGGKTFPFTIKYLHAHATASILNENWPIYRYSEVLLLLAEALHEQGKSSEALPYLNQVRTRAGLGAVSSTAGLSDVILAERRVELAFENKRWLDLVRTGKAVSVITAYGQKIKANPQAYYFLPGINPVPASFTDIKLKFPLPASESLLSPYF
jgi:starch-binding outer membrane protein, SusD/RagB family